MKTLVSQNLNKPTVGLTSNRTNQTNPIKPPVPEAVKPKANPDVLKSLLDELEDKIDVNMQNYKRLSKNKGIGLAGQEQDKGLQKQGTLKTETTKKVLPNGATKTTVVITNANNNQGEGNPKENIVVTHKVTTKTTENNLNKPNNLSINENKNILESQTFVSEQKQKVNNERTEKPVSKSPISKLKEANGVPGLHQSKKLDKSHDSLLSNSSSEEKKNKAAKTKIVIKTSQKAITKPILANEKVEAPRPKEKELIKPVLPAKKIPELNNSKILHQSQTQNFDFDDKIEKARKKAEQGSAKKIDSNRSIDSNKDVPILTNSQITKYQKEDFAYNANRSKGPNALRKNSPSPNKNKQANDKFDEEFEQFSTQRGNQVNTKTIAKPKNENPPGNRPSVPKAEATDTNVPKDGRNYTFAFANKNPQPTPEETKPTVFAKVNKEPVKAEIIKPELAPLENAAPKLSLANKQPGKEAADLKPKEKPAEAQRGSVYDRRDYVLKNGIAFSEEIALLKKAIEGLKDSNEQLKGKNKNLKDEVRSAKDKHSELEKRFDFQNRKLKHFAPELFDDSDKNSFRARRIMFDKKLGQIEEKIEKAFDDGEGSIFKPMIVLNIKHTGINKEEVDYLIDLDGRQQVREHAKPINVLEASQTIPNKF